MKFGLSDSRIMEQERISTLAARMRPFKGSYEDWLEWREQFEAYLDTIDPALANTFTTERPEPRDPAAGAGPCPREALAGI